MLKRSSLVVIVVLLLVIPASAQEVFNTQVFSVVARGEGLGGTQWVTDLTVFNPTDAEVTIGIGFFPAGQDNLFDPTFPYRLVLAPGETQMIEDVILNTFGLDQDIKGLLVLLCDPAYLTENEEGAMILAVTRTYNTGGDEGTFGQTVPSLVSAVNVGWASSFVTGARNDDAFRSNLGIAATSPMAAPRVFYRIMTADGTVVAEGSKVIRIASMNQWSFDKLGVGDQDGPLTVELWLDPDDMEEDPCEPDFPIGFLAYVSKVDNGTGDAEFLTAAPMMPYTVCLMEQ
jgi:hypothetical protein